MAEDAVPPELLHPIVSIVVAKYIHALVGPTATAADDNVCFLVDHHFL